MGLNSWIQKTLDKYPESFPIRERIRILLNMSLYCQISLIIILIFDLIFRWFEFWLLLVDLYLLFFFLLLELLIIRGKGLLAIRLFNFIYIMFLGLFIGEFHQETSVNFAEIFSYVIFLLVIALISELISIDLKQNKIHFFIGLLIITSFYIIALIKNQAKIGTTLSYLIIAAASLIFGLLAAQKSHELRIAHFNHIVEEEKRKTDELTKVLEQYIPICSHCKSIRKNTGEWVRIEAYIREQSSNKLQFTHGLCDKCVKEYFPDEK